MANLNTRRNPQLPPQGGIAPRPFEPSNTLRTHEGAPAAAITPELALRRSVCACLLWEDQFYESGVTIADRIATLAGEVSPRTLADLAVDARSHFHLRHVPLLLCAVLARTGSGSRLVSDAIEATIQRPDELSEFLAIYAKVNGVEPKDVRRKLSAQVKLGLGRAFGKFDRYQLAKYLTEGRQQNALVRGRDVMFLTHPRPGDDEHRDLYRRIARKESIVEGGGGADTWEANLSAGADKRETFERLIRDQKIGYLALLRNLRNMVNAKVDTKLIEEAIVARRGARRVLPFRYVAAARACPQMEPAIDQALSEAVSEMPALPGKTVVLVDISSSMDAPLSGKSDLNRMDAAASLASLICGDLRVFSFSDGIAEITPRPIGMAGVRAILGSQPHNGTALGEAIHFVQSGGPAYAEAISFGRRVRVPMIGERSAGIPIDRLIVITDEQSQSPVPEPTARHAYMINVASYQNGVGYGERWTHLDGFSEQVIRFIREFEALDLREAR